MHPWRSREGLIHQERSLATLANTCPSLLILLAMRLSV